MKAKRRLSEIQVIRDLRGMKRIIGATVVDATRVRDSNKFKFAEASQVNRRSAVAYVGGPVGIVNGACSVHANLESMNYYTVRVIPFHTIEKGEELTLRHFVLVIRFLHIHLGVIDDLLVNGH